MQILIAAVIAAAILGGLIGWTVNGWRHDAAAKQQAVAQLLQQRKNDKKVRILTKKYQEAARNTRVVYRTITERIKDETADRTCLNAGAVSVWNDALSGTSTAPGTTESTGGPDTATADK